MPQPPPGSALSDHIDYKDIERLFWNTYPFKIVVASPTGRRQDIQFIEDGRWMFCDEVADFRRTTRRAYLKECTLFCPAEDTWKVMDTGNTFNFFFTRREDADRFIQGNRARITTVHRPASQGHIDALANDRKVVLRDRLFWDRYRWCIVFRQSKPEEEETLDSWVSEYFSEPAENRYYYSYSKTRRIYFNDENDVIMTKIAFHQLIDRVEKIVLNSEVGISNEYYSGSEAS